MDQKRQPATRVFLLALALVSSQPCTLAISPGKTDDHWAYMAPSRPPLPAQANRNWVTNPIDYFVSARLSDTILSPSSAADPAQLARRLHLDLIGLPPDPRDVRMFVRNPSETAYEHMVDRLLASPRYGEKWASGWLDLARYADSNGFQADQLRDSWAYRDWVINAFNSGMPFDRFVIEQIAGDLLPDATKSQRIATGFHRAVTCNVEGGVHPEENRVNQVVDRVNTTGTVFLGTSLECAQCHDHKYDPFTMKDYYQVFAFFNNTPLEVKQEGKGVTWNFFGPKMDLPLTGKQQVIQEDLLKKLSDHEDEIAHINRSLKVEQAEWEARMTESKVDTPLWQPMTIASFVATGGASHRLLEDQSVLVYGKNPDRSTYTITANSDITEITAFRLETLTDPSMKKNGPGRNFAAPQNPNFILNTFNVSAGGASLSLASASADFSQKNWDVAGAIDDNPKTGWGINPQFSESHHAVFTLSPSLKLNVGQNVTFRLTQNYGGGRTIGRIRLSAIHGDPEELILPKNIHDILSNPKRSPEEELTIKTHFSEQHPRLNELKAGKAKLQKRIAAIVPAYTLVMQEMDTSRATHIFQRGDYLSPGERVESCAPSALHQFNPNLPRNRLGLARWLVDPNNPLIGRVTVNRWWAEFMGHGIVATPEDFGTQSQPPTHPGLLDWLAVEFMESGWSIKHIHKLIVMSSTYCQTSRISEEHLARDPGNRLFARAPRVRMSAEMIRDNALASSGLLSLVTGGIPIYPPQPTGIWRHVGRNAPKYNEHKDERRFRRGVYIIWRRAAPYPSFVNFDAPDRGTCVVQRTRTNTPVQALTLMNDKAFIEMALALANRLIKDLPSGSATERLQYAFELTLGRSPRKSELDFLLSFLERQLGRFKNHPEKARQLVEKKSGLIRPAGDDALIAAWFTVANILLNLDESITKG